MNENYIEIRGLKKSFDGFQALKGVSLSIPKGSFVTLLGPSGCGKTTLLRTVAGFYEQDGGEIFIGGKRMSGIPPDKRSTPLVFQDYALFPHMTIKENIGYGLKLQKTPKSEADRRIRDQMELFSLLGLEDRYPRQLSGGQQQRVAFARALVLGYDILLLDEPLSNLDAKLRIEVRAQLRKIQQKTGMTVLYVTHDQEEALAMSDIIAVMRQGEIVQAGTAEEIYYEPNSRFVADFIGSVNLLPAVCRGPGSGAAEVEILGVGGEVPAEYPAGRFLAVVRPERISLCGPEEGDLTGEIAESVFLGRMMQYRVKAAGQTLRVETLGPDRALRPGDAVGLKFDWSKLHLIEEDDIEKL